MSAMTDQKAIELAKQELSTSSYLGEITRSPGIRAIHAKRCSWLARLVALAEYGLKYKASVGMADDAACDDVKDERNASLQVQEGHCVNRANTHSEKPMPMTIEELRSMRGEPVYIDPYGWRICFGVEPADIHGGVEKVNLGNSCYLPLSGYGKLWLPYHQKPHYPTDDKQEGAK